MPDFTKRSNYTEQTSFDSVVYGANAPVLEVEQNEMQEIVNTKFRRVTDLIGNCVHPMSNGSVSMNSSKVVTLTNCVAIAHGLSAFIPSATVTVSATNKYAYVKMERQTVTGTDTIKAYGNTAGAAITNPIIDTRAGKETSRRTVIVVTLSAGSSVPSDTDTTTYAPVGVLENGEFVPEYVMDSYADLGLSLNSAGEMCVVYDE